MPDNLTVEISANTTKLRAELTKAQAELRNFNKELRRAADAGDAAGINKFSESVERTTAQINKLNTALRRSRGEAEDTAKGFTGLTGSLGPLLERFESIRGALLGFAGFEVLRKAADLLGDVSKEIREYVNLGKAAGLEPTFLKALNEGLEDAGATAEVSKRAVIALTDAMTKARQESGSLTQAFNGTTKIMRGSQGAAADMGQQVQTLRGGVNDAANSLGNLVQVGDSYVKVMKGGVQPTIDLQKPIASLGVNMAQFTDNVEGNRKAVLAIIGRLKELQKISPQLATALGNQLFPKMWADIADAITNLDEKKLSEIAEELVKTGRAITPEAEAQAKEYNLALKNLSDTFDSIKMRTATALFPEVTKTLKGDQRDIEKLTELLDTASNDLANSEGFKTAVQSIKTIFGTIFDPATYADLWSQFTAWWAQAWPQLSTAVTDFTSAIPGYFDTAWSAVKSAAQSVFDWLSSSLGSVTQSMSSATAAAQTSGGASPAGFATGGLVPGRGTGDTVRALLTPGEYVLQRSAVDRLGLGLLNTLNGLRSRLMPRRGRTHYADGGIVTARTSDGATVHLHFPGGSFALRGDKGIVQGLTREARRASMLSAGRMPGVAVA
jgi:hypothetical protein